MRLLFISLSFDVSVLCWLAAPPGHTALGWHKRNSDYFAAGQVLQWTCVHPLARAREGGKVIQYL